MKQIPFDLTRALAGDKVVTRDGREVTQLTLFKNVDTLRPLFAVIGQEVYMFTDQGKASITGAGVDSDLFMAPKTVKRWVNFYDNSIDSYASETAAKNMAFPTIAIAIAVPVEFEEGYGCNE